MIVVGEPVGEDDVVILFDATDDDLAVIVEGKTIINAIHLLSSFLIV